MDERKLAAQKNSRVRVTDAGCRHGEREPSDRMNPQNQAPHVGPIVRIDAGSFNTGLSSIHLLLAFLLSLGPVEGAVSREENPRLHVLVVEGVNKDPEEIQSKEKSAIGLQRIFLKESSSAHSALSLLVPPNSFVRDASGESNRSNLEKSIQEVAGRIEPGEAFLFYYVGQANIVGKDLRLNLPGPDVTHHELAEWLGQVEAATKLIVLDCPGAGMAAEALADPKNILILSARVDQPYSPRFSEFFVPALTNPEADADDDGRVSLLEAFRLASERIDEMFREQDLMKTETALLEDDGDGVPSRQPWKRDAEKKDGARAERFFFE